MKKEDIKKLRMQLGKFLHDYYTKFGEEAYENFLKKLEPAMLKEYGEPFSIENLRIMEAEFVTFNARLNEKSKLKAKETSTKQ